MRESEDGPGKCVRSCFAGACKGCGICADVCPRNAITISVSDGDRMLDEAFRRIEGCAGII